MLISIYIMEADTYFPTCLGGDLLYVNTLNEKRLADCTNDNNIIRLIIISLLFM